MKNFTLELVANIVFEYSTNSQVNVLAKYIMNYFIWGRNSNTNLPIASFLQSVNGIQLPTQPLQKV